MAPRWNNRFCDLSLDGTQTRTVIFYDPAQPSEVRQKHLRSSLTAVVSLQLRRRVDGHFAQRAVQEAPGFLLLRFRVALRLGLGLRFLVRFRRRVELRRPIVSSDGGGRLRDGGGRGARGRR